MTPADYNLVMPARSRKPKLTPIFGVGYLDERTTVSPELAACACYSRRLQDPPSAAQTPVQLSLLQDTPVSGHICPTYTAYKRILNLTAAKFSCSNQRQHKTCPTRQSTPWPRCLLGPPETQRSAPTLSPDKNTQPWQPLLTPRQFTPTAQFRPVILPA